MLDLPVVFYFFGGPYLAGFAMEGGFVEEDVFVDELS